jgi:hypothetical protein
MNHNRRVGLELVKHQPTLKVVLIFYRHEFPAQLDSVADQCSFKRLNELAPFYLASSACRVKALTK